MVLTKHKKFYDEIFRIKGFLNSPFLMFGFQELTPGFSSRLKDAKSFKGLLHLMGVKDITVLDYEDPRADIHFDMNYSFNQHTNKTIGGYEVVADVGCLEHVWNSAQAMKNCMDSVKVGGLYFLHTPVAGYCNHGLHTFNADALKWVVENNGFKIEYCHYSDKEGTEIAFPKFNHQGNAIIWLVARRVEIKDRFHLPIQDRQTIHESRKTHKSESERHPNNWEEIDPIGTAGKEGSKAGEKLKGALKLSNRGNVLVDQSEKKDETRAGSGSLEVGVGVPTRLNDVDQVGIVVDHSNKGNQLKHIVI